MPAAAPDHRALVEILSWDWPLHVGMAPPSMPPEQRCQGDLFYVQHLEISVVSQFEIGASFGRGNR